MRLNARHGTASPPDVDPAHIVIVRDFSPDTLRSIIAHLDVSSQFEHLIYREAELDGIWSLTGSFLLSVRDLSEHDAVQQLHAGVHSAHDLVAENRPEAAAAVLRKFL
jgi:hypothetical protein